MNISVSKIEAVDERNGEADESRPAYVSDALNPEKCVGYRDGLPIVDPPEEIDMDTAKEDVGPLYEHYRRGTDLLPPMASPFIRRLCQSPLINSANDVAEELNTDLSVVEKALDLHMIEIDSVESDSDDDSEDTLKLPSGESVPLDVLNDDPWKDKLVLTQLLATDGLSTEETASYLSEELDTRITESDIRRAATDVNLLNRDSTKTRNDSVVTNGVMRNSDAKLRSTPWDE